MSDNSYNYIGTLPGCSLTIISADGSTTAVTGGTITGTTPCGIALNTPAPAGKDSDMALTVDEQTIEISTTLPSNLVDAYLGYLQDKELAMYSGGSCKYAGTIQTFDAAGSCYKHITQTSLMSLSGVTGSPEQGGKVNINFTPTACFWEETLPANNGTKTVTVFRTRKPCVACQDYNDLFMMEMILYHAINKVAWRIMRYPGVTGYPPGTWPLYQAALARWNANTYASQYVFSLTGSEDSFVLKIGWINPTCSSAVGFCVYAALSCTPGEDANHQTDAALLRYRLLYTGTPTTTDPGIGFIANPDTQTVYYTVPNMTGIDFGLALARVYGGNIPASVGAITSYTVATSVQEFNVPENTNSWIVGLVCADATNGVRGNGYGAIGFQLGYAQQVDTTIVPTNTRIDTYAAVTSWSATRDNKRSDYTRTDAVEVLGMTTG